MKIESLISRKSLLIAMLVSILILSASCEKNTDGNDNVSLYFEYSLSSDNGADMNCTKSGNEDVYKLFHDKMVDGTLTAQSYDLTLREINTGVVYEVIGNWTEKNLITLRTGTYQVTGKSTCAGNNIQDKCSLIFDETIEINENCTSICLHAVFNCSLLIFCDTSIESLTNYNGNGISSDFFCFDKYIYAFVNSTLYDESNKDKAYILGLHTDGLQFKIYTKNLSYQKGKYYVYTEVSSSYLLPYMEEGGSEIITSEHEYVDMGLSVKWSKYNIGATKPEEIGARFSWGEVEIKNNYSWSYYKWGPSNNILKYNSNDQKKTLELADDAAYVNWGIKWRMPTREEAMELLNNCSMAEDTVNGIFGYLATSSINGESIFFPVSGQQESTSADITWSKHVMIWTSETEGDNYAYRLAWGTTWKGVADANHRHDGLCIRAVFVD